MTTLTKCPKCSGQMFPRSDEDGEYKECLQCSRKDYSREVLTTGDNHRAHTADVAGKHRNVNQTGYPGNNNLIAALDKRYNTKFKGTNGRGVKRGKQNYGQSLVKDRK